MARRAREILQQRSEPPQEVVCYGVGDIVGSNTARLQLALALCLAQALDIERGAAQLAGAFRSREWLSLHRAPCLQRR